MPLCKILPYFFHGYYILWICLSSLSVSGYEMKWQSLITDLQIQHLPPTREQGESPLPFNYYADSNWTRFWYFSFGMWAFFLTKSLEVFGFLFFYFFSQKVRFDQWHGPDCNQPLFDHSCCVEADQMSVFGLADGTQGSDQKGSLADKLLIILLCTFCLQWVLSCTFGGKVLKKVKVNRFTKLLPLGLILLLFALNPKTLREGLGVHICTPNPGIAKIGLNPHPKILAPWQIWPIKAHKCDSRHFSTKNVNNFWEWKC